jgi:hypothetical protein
MVAIDPSQRQKDSLLDIFAALTRQSGQGDQPGKPALRRTNCSRDGVSEIRVGPPLSARCAVTKGLVGVDGLSAAC